MSSQWPICTTRKTQLTETQTDYIISKTYSFAW